MTRTMAYPYVKEVAVGWEKLYGSATCSGVLPDAAHEQRGGYHVGRNFQGGRNYSVVRADDRAPQGPGDGAAAIDMTLSTKDMVLCTRRLRAVYDNPNDPRRKYLNAFNGWDGSGDATRFDMVARRTERASSDHKWHIHLEVRRRWLLSRAMVTAVLSALAGDSVAQYLAKVGATAPAAPAASGSGKAAAAPKAPAYPGRPLRRNDTQTKADASLKAWQQRMIARGWKSLGAADGLFGAKTEAVVKHFQTACRIPADGEIGPVTWPKPWTQPIGS